MSLNWVQRRVSDGAAQDTRLPYALRKGYFRPQERALHDHLAMSARLAREIRLTGQSGDRMQNWSPLFEREPAVALAEVLATPLSERRLEFEEALDRDLADAAWILWNHAGTLAHIRGVLLIGGYSVLAEQIDRLGDDLRTPDLLVVLDCTRGLKAGEMAMGLSKLADDPLGDNAIARARDPTPDAKLRHALAWQADPVLLSRFLQEATGAEVAQWIEAMADWDGPRAAFGVPPAIGAGPGSLAEVPLGLSAGVIAQGDAAAVAAIDGSLPSRRMAHFVLAMHPLP